RESMLKIAPPAFGKSRDFSCATKQSDVVLLACIQLGDIAYPYTAFASFDQFNRVTRSDFAFLQHGKIEARALTRQESFDDVRAAELDPELITGHPGLGHHYGRRANAKFVPDV